MTMTLAGWGRVVLLCAVLAACGPTRSQPASSDPFATVAQRSEQSYQRGVELYERGEHRQALDAFEQARLLSPSRDQRVEEMIERLQHELSPTAIPTQAAATATPAPTAAVPSTATPALDSGEAYFGQVYLVVVPGQDMLPPPMHEFSAQDQIALYVEKLNERLRLPLLVRVFDLDNSRPIADVRADSVGRDVGATPARPATPPAAPSLVRFWNNFVWYHVGPEPAGHYRVELYAPDAGPQGDVLTYALDYFVGETLVPIPTASPTPQPLATPVVVVPPVPAPQPEPAPPQVAPPPPQPVPQSPPEPVITSPAVAPVPQALPAASSGVSASSIALAATPAALRIVNGSKILYVADTSGLVWRFEDGQPVLTRPISVAGEPRGLDVDESSGRLYVAVRSPGKILVLDGTTGQELASAALASEPGEVRLSGSTGKLFVLLPEAEALEVLDIHDLARVQLLSGLPHVSGMALDEGAHALYLGHLDGQVSLVDTDSGTVTDHLSLTGPGLSGISAAHGVVYAINTPGQEVVAVDVATRDIRHLQLAGEPSAIAVSPTTGILFVLESARRAIVGLDGSDGTASGEVRLDDVPQEAGVPSLDLDRLWLLPHLAISSVDDTIWLIEPGSRLLSTADAASLTAAESN